MQRERFDCNAAEDAVCFDSLRQGSKIALVGSYLRVPQAAGQVKIRIFLVKIKFFPIMPIVFVMQGKCTFSDISRPVRPSQQFFSHVWKPHTSTKQNQY